MSDAPVAVFKRGKGRPTTARKRSASPAAENASGPSSLSAPDSTVVRPTKKAATTLLSSGTKRSASDRERERRDDIVDVHWSTSGAQSVTSSALEILAGDEAEELLAKRQRVHGPGEEDEGPTVDDGMYHGLKAYGNKIKKQQEVAKTMRVGPVRVNNSTVRTATIVDYQPDVCKDYKETGFCGFGDSCKFLHDRGTYLSGWQIDQKWDAAQRALKGGGPADESSSDSDEDIPFACLICRKPYTDPVVTRCRHYFCSACAIKRFAKTPKCLACGAPTSGIFNRADKVIDKMRKAKEAEDGNGEGGSDAGEGDSVKVDGLQEDASDEE
ncbi:hypothetical protein BKA62DRAFT_687892 [Auriculariales sp. MPI-PUGE-AT-0066]|nr:hypothetical protein BKA62DRAFT_687892 [Auriculariales sp. MPI-PUGE-AT-0066]